jgi:hypothetical protein
MAEHFVGNSEIHEEQFLCSQEIMKHFQDSVKSVLLVAQMQQGKTEVIVATVNQFIQARQAEGSDYVVFMINNISDNVLRNQVQLRFGQALLPVVFYTPKLDPTNKIILAHHAGLKNLKNIFETHPIKNTAEILIVIDECHYALDASTKEKAKPFHEFMKAAGVNYGGNYKTWENKKVQVLSVSATPYVQCIKSHLDSKAFEAVSLTPSEAYYSLEDAYSAGRLFQSQPLVKNHETTEFLEEANAKFLEECEAQGPGHLMIRTTGVVTTVVARFYLELQKEGLLDIMFFDCNNNKNLHLLDDYISNSVRKPMVNFIHGTLRAGKTLTRTKHIRGWIESPNADTDSMSQTVGRSLGYNGKHEDTYPIFCNLKKVKDALEFYSGVGLVPKGRNNKITRQKVYTIMISDEAPDEEVIRKHLREQGFSEEIRKFMPVSHLTSYDALALIERGTAIRNTSGTPCATYYIDGYEAAVKHFEAQTCLRRNAHRQTQIADTLRSLKFSYLRWEITHRDYLGKYITLLPSYENAYSEKIKVGVLGA